MCWLGWVLLYPCLWGSLLVFLIPWGNHAQLGGGSVAHLFLGGTLRGNHMIKISISCVSILAIVLVYKLIWNDECLNEMCFVLAVYFMNDTCMCVINSMNFLSCYEVRSIWMVMAWMLEISFILRNFHEQIEFPQSFPFCNLQDAGCGNFVWRNMLSTICGMRDAEMTDGKFLFLQLWSLQHPFRMRDAGCGMRGTWVKS